MDGASNNFNMGKATPITFQTFGELHDSSLPMQENMCTSASNTTGFTQTPVNTGDAQHHFVHSAPSNNQHYFFSTTSMESAATQAPATVSLTEDWEFQPDPNIEGHWIAVLQLHDTPPPRRQNAEMEYPADYREQPNEQLYQTHPQPYSSPFESYPAPRSFSSSSSMSSPYLNSPQMAGGGWYSVIHQVPVTMRSPVSSPGYLTPSLCSVSTEQSNNDTPIPGSSQKYKSSAKAKAGSMQSGLFQCRICRESFSKKSNRNEHERIHDNDKPRAPCTENGCHKDFGRPADLARHRRSYHLNDRHVCRYCSKTFNRSDIKRRHEANSCRKQKAELQIRMQAEAHRRDTIGRRRWRF